MNGQYLHDGACIDHCPYGLIPVGTGRFNRRCAPRSDCIPRYNNCRFCKMTSTSCFFGVFWVACLETMHLPAQILFLTQINSSARAPPSRTPCGVRYRVPMRARLFYGCSAKRIFFCFFWRVDWGMDPFFLFFFPPRGLGQFTSSIGNSQKTACTKCMNRQYMLGGVCHPSCPVGMRSIGRGTFSRYCAGQSSSATTAAAAAATDAPCHPDTCQPGYDNFPELRHQFDPHDFHTFFFFFFFFHPLASIDTVPAVPYRVVSIMLRDDPVLISVLSASVLPNWGCSCGDCHDCSTDQTQCTRCRNFAYLHEHV